MDLPERLRGSTDGRRDCKSRQKTQDNTIVRLTLDAPGLCPGAFVRAGCGRHVVLVAQILAHGPTKRHGTGIGLSLVRQILRSHHGSVGVQSAPGEGTAVRLSFGTY
jgi:hypothetical protein